VLPVNRGRRILRRGPIQRKRSGILPAPRAAQQKTRGLSSAGLLGGAHLPEIAPRWVGWRFL